MKKIIISLMLGMFLISLVYAGATTISQELIGAKESAIIELPSIPIEDKSGFGWDNLVTTNEDLKIDKVIEDSANVYPAIKVDNLLGLGSTLMSAVLEKHTESCGEDCMSQFEITTFQDSPLVDSVKFETILEDGDRKEQPIRGYQFYIQSGVTDNKVIDYEWICKDTGEVSKNGTKIQDCSNQEVGSHIEYTPEWIEYPIGTVMPSGTYIVKLDGQKRPDRIVDWVITSQGKEISEWSTWGAGTNKDCGSLVLSWRDDFNSLNTSRWNTNGCTVSGGTLTCPAGFNYINSTTKYLLDKCNRMVINMSDQGNNYPTYGWNSAGQEGVSTNPYAFFGNGFGLMNNVANNITGYTGVSSYHIYNLTINETMSNSYQDNINLRTAGGSNGGNQTIRFTPGSEGQLFIGWIEYWENAASSITLNSPADNYISPTNSVTFNATATVVGGATLTNATRWVYYSNGTYKGSQTNTSLSGITQTVLFTSTLPDESYIWFVRFCDSDGVCGFSENRTVKVDTTSPVIHVYYPNGTIPYLSNGTILSLNYSATDTNLGSCWKDYNGINTTMASCANSTFTYLTGKDSITIWANDTVGNIGYATSSFISAVYSNSINYNSSTYETKSESFSLNMSYNTTTYPSLTSNFIYNGTSYSTTISSDGTNTLIVAALSMPTTTTVLNNSFYWSVNFGTTQVNTTNYYQTVNPLSFGICSTTLNKSLINFTTKSAVSPYPTLNSTFKSTWMISSSATATKKSYTYEALTAINSSYAFCTSLDQDIYAESQIDYDANGYSPNSYYLTNATLNKNNLQNISLYLLNDSLATITVLKLLNTAQQGVPGVTIYIEAYDVGTNTFQTIGMAQSDFNGEAVTYLNWYDTFYKFVLVEDLKTIMITGTTKISATPVIFNIPMATTYSFEKFKDFQYSLTFNNATNNFILTFVKPSALVDQGCLRVTKRTAKNDTDICLNCETSSSATVSCNIAGYGNGTYIATFYATGSWMVIDMFQIIIGGDFSKTIYEELGNDDGSFYAMIMAGLVLSVTVISPVFGIIGMLLGILAGSALGFSQVNVGIFIVISILGGIIIWIIRR